MSLKTSNSFCLIPHISVVQSRKIFCLTVFPFQNIYFVENPIKNKQFKRYTCSTAIQSKMQYVEISNIIDTILPLKHPISGQSTPMVKDCMDIFLIWEILLLVIEEHYSSAKFFRNLSRYI